MMSQFITEISAKLNPFSATARSARLFLTNIPPSARSQGTIIHTKLLPRSATDKASIQVKFKDGKVLDLDCDLGVKRLVEECDRHSRVLKKQADLSDA